LLTTNFSVLEPGTGNSFGCEVKVASGLIPSARARTRMNGLNDDPG
jgi:hypothetical protein